MTERHARYRAPDADRRRRPTDGFRTASRGRFNRLAVDAVASLPPQLLRGVDGVAVRIRDVPQEPGSSPLGPPLVRYLADPAGGPGQLEVYRRALELRATSKQDLLELIREAVAHEIADHLGLGDDELGDLGW